MHTTLGAVRAVGRAPDVQKARPGGQAAIRFAGRIWFPGGEKREVERRRRFEETMRFGGEVEARIPSDPWL